MPSFMVIILYKRWFDKYKKFIYIKVMEKVGIICEYNPFHNGHIYHINEIKKKYPDSLIILVLNGYFLERGEISILDKYTKTEISLKYGVDIVMELPFLYGTQSADTFAYVGVKILNELKVDRIIFGSECNDINKIMEIAKIQLSSCNNDKLKELLDKGVNYPTALAKSLGVDFEFTSNDLLGISYVKAILEINSNITAETIKRTNSYLDTTLDSNIVSASNIRERINNNENISKYLPNELIDKINTVDKKLYFSMLKAIIIRSDNLNEILDVDEGIEYRLKDGLFKCDNLSDYIEYVKTKRYTYNKINRMLLHILLSVKKEDAKYELDTLKILGININGQKYLNSIKKDITIPFNNKESLIYEFETKASIIYDMLTNSNTYEKEKTNKPIIY